MLTTLIGKGLPRQETYVMVQRCAMESWESGRPFPDIVRRDPEITRHVSQDELDLLFDTSYYTRHEDVSLSRVFGE